MKTWREDTRRRPSEDGERHQSDTSTRQRIPDKGYKTASPHRKPGALRRNNPVDTSMSDFKLPQL